MTFVLFTITLLAGISANRHDFAELLRHGTDTWGYYQFLPASLGSHGWDQLPWTHKLENGNHLSLFTVGVAFLQAPFFYLAASVAYCFNYPVDGYSLPFVYAQFVASAVYLAAGCRLLYHALRRRFGPAAATLASLLVFGATNLYFYAVFSSGMSHVYAFFLFAWMHYLTVRMIGSPRADRLVGLFLCCSLIVLVRQLNAVALLFPLLYGAPIRTALRERLRWVRLFPLAAVGGLLLAVLVLIPQLMYWKAMTGNLLVFTYGKKGEGFFWNDPHLLDVLVSHQNGWWIYTPLMLFVTGVLVYGAWRGRPGMRLLLLMVGLAWYVYASWWCWWLGGSFGHRGFIEYYALLAIPLAWAMERLLALRRPLRDAGLVGAVLLVFLNVRMSILYQWPWEGAEWTWDKLLAVWSTALFQ